MGKPLKLKA